MLTTMLTYLLMLFLVSRPLCTHARTPSTFKLNQTKFPTAVTGNSHIFEILYDKNRNSMVGEISKLQIFSNNVSYLKADVRYPTELPIANLEVISTRHKVEASFHVATKLDCSELTSALCGVTDASKMLHGAQKYVYFTGQPRWSRNIPMVLTYAFSPDNLITSLSLEDLHTAFQLAFSHWASVIPVTFMEYDDYEFADIKIGFYYGDHGDGEAFDGVLGVLAHAFSPESGRFHLDAAETWTVDFEKEKSHSAVDLESVATHEIGHLLGLAHTDVKDAVMYSSLKPREKKVELKLDDIIGIQALYGSNPNFSFQGFSESEMTSNDAVRWSLGAEILISFSWLLTVIFW